MNRSHTQDGPNLGPDGPPAEIFIGVTDGRLVACPLSGTPLFLYPIGPGRLRAEGGPEAYVYMEYQHDGDELISLKATLSHAISLAHEPH